MLYDEYFHISTMNILFVHGSPTIKISSILNCVWYKLHASFKKQL